VPEVKLAASPFITDTFRPACAPVNVTVQGPPALPVTVTVSTACRASKAVSTSLDEALWFSGAVTCR
jgi:hypothetical protein